MQTKPTRSDRAARYGHRGRIVWLTGLSGAGKSTIATASEQVLWKLGRATYLLDGDDLRHGVSAGLGFSDDDRMENVRRVGEIARLFSDAGLIVLVALISPHRAARDAVRAKCEHGELVEVYVRCPIDVCEMRDPKGLYRRARAGSLTSFTGIDSPYEAPLAPELDLATHELDVGACVEQVIACVRQLEAQ